MITLIRLGATEAVEPPTEIREINLGDVQIEVLYLGDIQILTVYLGDTKVYGDT